MLSVSQTLFVQKREAAVTHSKRDATEQHGVGVMKHRFCFIMTEQRLLPPVHMCFHLGQITVDV